MNFTVLFWIINGLTTLLRMLIMGRLGLSGDEAHYWAYSRHPELSYFDHPPAIGYIIKFTTAIFGANEFGVRISAVVFFFFMSYFLFKLVKEMYGEKTAFWAVVMVNLIPAFSFLGAVMAIPDSPLAFLWVVFIYYFRKFILEQKKYYWYILGAVLGLGLLSKYNAVLLALSVFLFLLLSAEHRQWLMRKEPYLALCLSSVMFLPVIIWNLQNNFASFGFQLKHGFGKVSPQISLETLGKCVGAQAGYISPIIFLVMWTVLGALVLRYYKKKERDVLLVLAFSMPSLLLFNGIAVFHEILPHWPAMGYLVLLISVARYSVKLWDRTWFKNLSLAGWTLALVLTVLIPVQAMYKVLKPEWFMPKAEAMKVEDGIIKAEKVDVTNELYGWKEVGKRIDELVAQAPEPKPFIFTHRHYIASQLSFYVPHHPEIYCFSDRVDAYDFWQRDLSALDERDGIFVCDEFFYTEPETIYKFKSWHMIDPVEYFRNGRKVRIFWLTYGRKFNLGKLPPEFTSELAGAKTTAMDGIRNLDHAAFWLINKDWSNRVLDFVMGQWSSFDARINLNTGMVLMVIAVGIYLWKTRRERFWKEFLLFAGIIIFGGIVVNLIKHFMGRIRPLGIWGNTVRSFGEDLMGSSFPSGHSQTVFSAAVYIAYKVRKFWWIVLFFAIAAFVSVSRIYVGVHFPADVTAGIIIGIVIAVAAVKIFKADKN